MKKLRRTWTEWTRHWDWSCFVMLLSHPCSSSWRMNTRAFQSLWVNQGFCQRRPFRRKAFCLRQETASTEVFELFSFIQSSKTSRRGVVVGRGPLEGLACACPVGTVIKWHSTGFWGSQTWIPMVHKSFTGTFVTWNGSLNLSKPLF